MKTTKKLWAMLLTVVLLVCFMGVPTMAEETAVFTENFDTPQDVTGVLQCAGWNFENSGMTWVTDTANTVAMNISVTSETRSGEGYALKMRTTSVVSQNVYKVVDLGTAAFGKVHKITGWVKLVADNKSFSAPTCVSAADAHTAGTSSLYTFGALNPKDSTGKNVDGYYLSLPDTNGEWVQFSRYFVPSLSNGQVRVLIGANVSTPGGYVLWDDIEIMPVENILFTDAEGNVPGALEGGKKYTGTVLMANTDMEKEVSYIGMQAIYERVSGKLQLAGLETFPVEISKRTRPDGNNLNAGQFRADLDFDLTAYPTGDYVAKIFIWDSVSGMRPILSGVQE